MAQDFYAAFRPRERELMISSIAIDGVNPRGVQVFAARTDALRAGNEALRTENALQQAQIEARLDPLLEAMPRGRRQP
jgi:hypothetical protein